MKRWLLGAVVAAAIVSACVGDDATPAPGTTTPDGGTATTTTPEGGSTSGSVTTPEGGTTFGTCFGQTFGALVPVTLTGTDATTKTEQVRVVGSIAYFARTSPGSDLTALFQAPYTAGTSPTLGAATSILDPRVGESDLAPAVASDASFIIFVHDNGGAQRFIWAAEAGGPGFQNGGNAMVPVMGQADDADPWLAGPSSKRLYFGRGQVGGTAMRIAYTDVTANAANAPTFGSVISFAPPCPVGSTDNCGKPVVTPDESLLLFASWTGGSAPFHTDYAMHEVALTKDATGAVTASSAVIDHVELGQRAVSWVSADGCEVLLDGGLTNTGVLYAKRVGQAHAH